MKNSTFGFAAVAAASIVAVAGSARADVVTARFTYSNLVRVNIVSPVLSGNVNTVTFNWIRQDLPAVPPASGEPATDTTVPANFMSFCVDLEQVVSPNTDYRFNIRTPAQMGWGADVGASLARLWVDHIAEVTDGDHSAAFQLAVWETVYDTDRNLSTGPFQATSPSAAIAIAQQWLGGLVSPTVRDLPQVVVLEHGDAQDQFTVIPAPGVGALGLAGFVLATRRNRRK